MRVNEWQSSLVRNAAGCAATGTFTAARICRRSGNIRLGSCSQFAPTATAPKSAITRAHSAGVCPSVHFSIKGRKLMVATAGSFASAAHSNATFISDKWKNVSRIRKSTPASFSRRICSAI